MKHQNHLSSRYYKIFTALSLAFVTSLVAFLEWPLLAKIPFAISLFLQLNAISELLFNRWVNQDESAVDTLISNIKRMISEEGPASEGNSFVQS